MRHDDVINQSINQSVIMTGFPNIPCLLHPRQLLVTYFMAVNVPSWSPGAKRMYLLFTLTHYSVIATSQRGFPGSHVTHLVACGSIFFYIETM